jgi:hypothetical protein
MEERQENFLYYSLLIANFLTGMMNFYALTFPFALFLSHFDGKLLSLFSMGNAAAIIGLGLILGELQKKVTAPLVSWMQHLIYGFGYLSVCLCAWLVSIETASMLFVILQASLINLNYLCGAGVINRVCTLDKSKKYYGQFSTFFSIGKVSSIFLLPLVLAQFGVIQTLFIFFIVQLTLLSLNLTLGTIFGLPLKKTHSTEKETIKTYLSSSLIRNCLIGFVFYYFLNNLWALGFYDVLDGFYTNTQELTQFICFFNLVQVVIEIFFNVFLFSFTLKRLGLAYTMLQNILFSIIACLIVFPIAVNSPWISKGMLMGNLFFSALSNVFFMPISNLTLVALSNKKKSWTNTIGNLTGCGLGVFLSSALFAVLHTFFGLSPIAILITIGLVLLGFWKVAIRWEDAYVEQLEEALEKQVFQGVSLRFDPRTISMIRKKFLESSSEVRLFLLDLVEDRNKTLLNEFLTTIFKENKKEEVKAALEVVYERNLTIFKDQVAELDESMLSLKTLRKISYNLFEKRVLKIIQNKSSSLFLEVLGLVLSPEIKGNLKEEGARLFNQLVESTDHEDLARALISMPSNPDQKGIDILTRCLGHESQEIREAALKKIPLKRISNWEQIFSLLKEGRYRNIFIEKLIDSESDGRFFVRYCNEKRTHLDKEVLYTLVNYLNCQQRVEDPKLLFTLIEQRVSAEVTIKALEALIKSKWMVQKKEAFHSSTYQALVDDVEGYAQSLSQYNPDHQPFLELQQHLALHVFGLLLSLKYKDKKIADYFAHFESPDPQEKAFAQESLGYLISKKELQTLSDMFERKASEEEEKSLVSRLFENTFATPSMKTFLCYELGKKRPSFARELINSFKELDQPFFLEAKQWALQQCGKR